MTFLPINGHVQIRPLKHETFISSGNDQYEEIGEVISLNFASIEDIQVGDRVYFDSWMAAKYPDGNGDYYWLVEYQHIRAIERNE